MHNIVNNLILIENKLKKRLINKDNPTIVAVSKTFSLDYIMPIINHGHKHFGENKVQEATEKWTSIKNDFTNIKLHMIGKLQTNKVKYVIPLFDYIHSLDSLKLANKISIEQKKLKKKLKIFIQINIGAEDQKSGIKKKDLLDFYEICTKKLDLDIIGLMCLPPNNENSRKYFFEMKELANKIAVKELSMGMSNDFLEASIQGATFVRIGSGIFGSRPKKL